MKLLIVLITYNRLEYTKRTLMSLWDTIQLPYYLVVVDNASTDGTVDYLKGHTKRNKVDKVILNPANYYPGKACNIGWTEGLKEYPQATHLMRLDNDMTFEKGWDLKAQEYFQTIDRMGQLGLDYDGGENKMPTPYSGMWLNEWPGCVGGPNIIKREIWDSGIRYDETPWEGTRSKVQEDARLSRRIKDMGYLVGHMDERLSYTFAHKGNWKDYKDYYIKTFTDRDYPENVAFIEGLDDEHIR